MRRMLIVSVRFPPVSAPDLQRVRMSLPHYRANGWEAVVLTVADRWQDGLREPALAATVPSDVRVVAARALPRRWLGWAGLGSLGIRSWPFLFFKGARLLRRERFDLVFISTTEFMAYTLGPAWRLLRGTPYVIDVQDPWRTDYYERPGAPRPPGGAKYLLARLLARAFEGTCFRRASGIMSVSPAYLGQLAARYPGVAAKPSAVIGFGASRADLDQAMKAGFPARMPRPEAGRIRLLYTGVAGPVMEPALSRLFAGLRAYADAHPERASRVRLHFAGTSYDPSGGAPPSVMPAARRHGVDGLVTEDTARVPYLEALRMQCDADGLILLGTDDPAYSPSKIYPYYLSGTPILAVVFAGSVAERLLDGLSCAFMARISGDADGRGAVAAVAAFLDAALDGFPAALLPRRNDAAFAADHLADSLARTQCRLFDRALSHPS